MTDQHVRLRDALRARHWQTYRTFCREYDRASRDIDPQLVGSWPSRAQFHRWLSGDLKGLPYPDHRRVLERMLPGWTTEQLFEPCGPGCPLNEAPSMPESLTASIVRSIGDGLTSPQAHAKDPAQIRAAVLAPVNSTAVTAAGQDVSLPELMATRLLALGQVERMAPEELSELSGWAGTLVDLDLGIDLTIAADGLVTVTYQYHLLNLTDKPVTRAPRHLWFQHSRGKLALTALRDSDRNVTIQRLHTADNIARFACQFSPAIEPGESARFAYTCAGAEFREDRYWRQEFARYTRRFTLNVRHCGLQQFGGFAATEDLSDGAEIVAQESVAWHYDGDDVVMTFTRDRLHPGQNATLRWESA